MTEQELEAVVDKLHEKKCLEFIKQFGLEVLERHDKVFVVAPKPNFRCSRWWDYSVVSKDHEKLQEIIQDQDKPVDEKPLPIPDHFRQYLDYLFRLSLLRLRGGDELEEENLHDMMDGPWYKLTEAERAIVGLIGSHQNKIEDMLEAVHEKNWPLL